MKITFNGAARIVTGSCYLIETKENKVLVDCGMFQGPKEISRLNYNEFAFNPRDIDYVFLTHAHIDHSGLLPKLVRGGFLGKIYSTHATADLCSVMLADSANRQVEDAQKENRQRLRQGLETRNPLYNIADAQETIKHFKRVPYDKEMKVTDDITVRYRDAGHILGSAIIELFIEGKKLVFSGDLGQWDTPIVRDPTLIDSADFLFIESTYGDRLHEDISKREEMLLKYAKETFQKGGKLMIPSFAVERTQELLYAIKKMFKRGEFPGEDVFLDSPLATRATLVFKRHPECYDVEASEYDDPFDFRKLVYTTKPRDSKKLNNIGRPCVIIAGSGMCTGGRIRHHLRHSLWNPKNTLLFVGYQAEGTLGRQISEGASYVDIMGETIAVKANVYKIDGFSAHADYKGLLKWAKAFSKQKPKTVFVMHGEKKASESLKEKLEKIGFNCKIPSIGDSVEL